MKCKLVFLVSFLATIMSCCNAKDRSTKESLSDGDFEYFYNLKEKYYKQRFIDADSNVYSPDFALQYGVVDDLPGGEHYGVMPEITIDSVNDLTLYINYPYETNEEVYIVSFLYKNLGYPGGNFPTPSCDIYFSGENKRTSVTFYDCLSCPEVFYQGKYYYIHEAYNLGIVAIDDTVFNFRFSEYIEDQKIEFFSYEKKGIVVNI